MNYYDERKILTLKKIDALFGLLNFPNSNEIKLYYKDNDIISLHTNRVGTSNVKLFYALFKPYYKHLQKHD